MGPAPLAATVIVTVRNESRSVDALLDSLLRGTRSPDEIVIADGGSTDDTVARLRARAAREPRLRVLETPGNRSVGRNAAIRAARNDVIACTDAGVEVEPAWLEEILRPFEQDPSVDVVAGFYRPVAGTAFERAAGVVSAPRLKEIDLDRFLPSTRSVAFRREAWRKAGGFDEALAHNEDTPFALAMKKAGCRFAFAPAAIVGWRPRGDLSAFYRQHRRFGFGDGESRVQGWFYATIAIKYGAALALGALGFLFPAAWIVLATGAVLFALQQASRGVGRIGALEALVGVPLLKVVYDVAYLSGYVRGRLSPPASR
ncbi:MAG TPA: glycosyltransferase [Candidatus Eisenbacteria bacterium]|nr:glycosyltransferase [Candidatus Eisenbacteria bacterium]